MMWRKWTPIREFSQKGTGRGVWVYDTRMGQVEEAWYEPDKLWCVRRASFLQHNQDSPHILIMERDDSDKPDPPEKSDLQRVCEWLWPEGVPSKWDCYDCRCTTWRQFFDDLDITIYQRDAIFWRIEEELDSVSVGLRRGGMAGAPPWVAAPTAAAAQRFYADTRGEALLKAALWVMKKEEA